MFASVGLGAFLIVILLLRLGMWIFRSHRTPEVAEPVEEEDDGDVQAAIDRWDRIQSRHSHSMYWDE